VWNAVSTDAPADARELEAVVDAYGEIARTLSGGVDQGDLLRLIAARACSLLKVRRSGSFLRDGRSQMFRGSTGHGEREMERRVQRLVEGVEPAASLRRSSPPGAPSSSRTPSQIHARSIPRWSGGEFGRSSVSR
jgi:hypothetical protein